MDSINSNFNNNITGGAKRCEKPAANPGIDVRERFVKSGDTGNPGVYTRRQLSLSTGAAKASLSSDSISHNVDEMERIIMNRLAGGAENIDRTDTFKLSGGRYQVTKLVDWKDIMSRKREARKRKYGKVIGGAINFLKKGGDKSSSGFAAMLANSRNVREARRMNERKMYEDLSKQIRAETEYAHEKTEKESPADQKARIRAELESYAKKHPDGELTVKYGDGFVDIGGVKLNVQPQ